MLVMKPSELLKFCLASALLLQFCEITAGVAITPLGAAPVCSGDSLELTCTMSGSFLEWSFFLVPDGETTSRRYSRILHTESRIRAQLIVNSIVFTFSIISAEGSEPPISTLLINPVSDGLNGTMVNCTDVATSNSTSTRIRVINETNLIGRHQNFEITTLSKLFERDGITAALEFTELNTFYSYHVSAIPQLICHMFIASTMVELKVFYNVHYNVSIVAASPCGKNNVTMFTEVYYAKCANPANIIGSSVVNIIGHMDPAIEGSNITISCLSGQMWNATCMGNGRWEPDIREVECKPNCGPPSPPTNGHKIPYISTTEGAEVTYVCWTAHQIQHQSVCKQTNATAICTAKGNWEPNSNNICDEMSGTNGLNHNEKIVVASVAVFIVTSIMFFFIGLFCGHFCRKQNIVSTATHTSAVEKHDPLYENLQQRQHENELELKTNVAYASVSQVTD